MAIGLAIGDVNGDGIPDIVTPDPAVFLGKVDGTFLNPVLLQTSSVWQGVSLADLRGTGKLDILGNVTTNSATNTTVFLNAGSGTFPDGSVIFLSGQPANCLAVADFNRDGHDDVAAGLSTGVEVLLGTGQLKALTPSVTLIDSERSCPYVGDFNNDGIPDLLLRASAGLKLYAGAGDGTFAAPVSNTVDFFELAIGDFNGDGNLDIIGQVHKGVVVIFGNGAGGFAQGSSVRTNVYEPTAIIAADLNGDGLSDFIYVANNPQQFVVYLNQGAGVFKSTIYPLPSFSPGSAFSADVNRDGILDLIVLGTVHSYVFLGQGAGVFSNAGIEAPPGFAGFAADLNGDGFPDLVLTDDLSAKVFLGNGSGSFGYPGNPDGVWYAPPGIGALAAANLQSQHPASGLSDLITVGTSNTGTALGLLLNQALLH